MDEEYTPFCLHMVYSSSFQIADPWNPVPVWDAPSDGDPAVVDEFPSSQWADGSMFGQAMLSHPTDPPDHRATVVVGGLRFGGVNTMSATVSGTLHPSSDRAAGTAENETTAPVKKKRYGLCTASALRRFRTRRPGRPRTTGANKYGRTGALKCTQCRDWHLQVTTSQCYLC
jgi:hypothetical protein